MLAGAAVCEQPVMTVDEIVAKVNGQIVTRGELDKQRLALEAELRERGLIGVALENEVELRMADEVRDRIDSMLLVQRGGQLGINVDADVTRWLARIQSQERISDQEEFRRAVQEQTGVSFEDFRQQAANRMLADRVKQEEVYRHISIPQAEIDRYYNDHKAEFVRQETVVLREILVSTGRGTTEAVAAAEKKARALAGRARRGEAKFGDLARQYSDAPTAAQDGELGSFRKGELAREIEEIVFRQARGYVTDPIRRQTGFEIYRVEEHDPAGQASEDEVEDEIRARLIELKAGTKERDYLTEQRRNAFIEIKSGFRDSGAAPEKDTTWQNAMTIQPETTTRESVAARAHRKFLHVIPYGHEKKDEMVPPSPRATPVERVGETQSDG